MAKNPAKPHFSKKEAISYGFDITKKHILFFVRMVVVITLISLISTIVKTAASPREIGLYFLFVAISFVIDLVIGMGRLKIGLKFVDGEKAKISDIFYHKSILNYFLGTFVKGVMVIIGSLLFIIPGIILSTRLQYTGYLIIDKNLGPLEAIKKSWQMTKGNTWSLFFFGIILGLINLLGILCLLVGLFVTAPLTLLATTFVYRKLLLHSKAA